VSFKKVGELSGSSESVLGHRSSVEVDGVLVKDSRHASSSITDGNTSSVGNVGRRSRWVILALSFTASIIARCVRYPQVGASSIENNNEVLWRSSNGDGTYVFSVVVVG